MVNILMARVVKALLASLILVFTSQMSHAFLLETMDRQRVDLTDYIANDRWTLMMFWATDCVACEEQKPALEAFYRNNLDGAATVVGIATDGVEFQEQIEKLNKLHNPSYPNFMAYSDVFRRQYEELAGKEFRITPTFLLFDADGNLHGRKYGYLDFSGLQQLVSANQ